MARLIGALGVPKVHLVGGKIGGTIALAVAARHPDLVDRLAVLGAPASLREMAGLTPGWRAQIARDGVLAWVRATNGGRMGSAMSPAQLEWWAQLMGRTATSTLEGFLHWLGLGTEELKRDPELAQDAVRVMTVHGAKGLEAPVVILADAGPRGDPRPGRLIWSDDGLPYWRASQNAREALTSELVEARKQRELEERSRLLYVGLTRARNALHLAGSAERSPLVHWRL